MSPVGWLDVLIGKQRRENNIVEQFDRGVATLDAVQLLCTQIGGMLSERDMCVHFWRWR